jgi:prepilin-type processing-associated H-X9-DG protein
LRQRGVNLMVPQHNTNLADDSGRLSQSIRRGLTVFELLIVIAILFVIVVLFFPTVQRGSGREAARRTQCKNNLKQIALALHHYESEYGMFPPAFTVDPDGHPLHSWRTLILPFLDQKELYETINLSKPWNDAANEKAFKTRLAVFSCPSTVCPANFTTYMGIAAKNGLFRPGEPRRITDISDGTSNTLMVMEVAPESAIHWMSPVDADEQMVLNFGQKKGVHTGGTHVAMADGSVRFISQNIAVDQLRSLITVSGNDSVGDF